MKNLKLLLALLMALLFVASAGAQQTHKNGKPYKLSKLPKMKEVQFKNGKTEVRKLPDGDSLIINYDYISGRAKGQKVHWNQPTSLKMIYMSTAKDSVQVIEVPTSTLVCDKLPAAVLPKKKE